MKTEFGKTFEDMKEVDTRRTPLQMKMDELGKQLSVLSFGIIGVIALVGMLQVTRFLFCCTRGVNTSNSLYKVGHVGVQRVPISRVGCTQAAYFNDRLFDLTSGSATLSLFCGHRRARSYWRCSTSGSLWLWRLSRRACPFV